MEVKSYKNSKLYKIYILLIGLFILVQPFLDIYKTVVENKIEILGISLIEVVNLLLIGLICVITFFLNYKKISKKKFMAIIVIGLLYLAYTILHIWNLSKFNTAVFPNNSISYFTELYYMVRALFEPLILILCVWLNGFSKKAFYLIFALLTTIVSGLIVISNIFEFSFIAYSVDNKVIVGNLFDWFNFNASYTKPLTSRGLFFSANQLANLMIILLPINIYNCLKNKKHNILYYIILFIQILSMVMLGTKTAVYGSIAICIGTIILSIIIAIKEKKNIINYVSHIWLFVITFVAIIPLTYYSPLMLEGRNKVYAVEEEVDKATVDEEVLIDEKDNQEGNTEKPKTYTLSSFKCNGNDNEKTLVKFLNKSKYNYKVNSYYLEVYPAKEDPEFWCDIYKFKANNYLGDRELKTRIFARVVERNNNFLDKYFGTGYTLNMLNLETDYYEIYYQFGILGLIMFVGPYVLLFVIALYEFLRKLKRKFTYENCFLFVSVFCSLVSAHLSGHLFSNLFISLPLSLTCIMLLLSVRSEE